MLMQPAKKKYFSYACMQEQLIQSCIEQCYSNRSNCYESAKIHSSSLFNTGTIVSNEPGQHSEPSKLLHKIWKTKSFPFYLYFVSVAIIWPTSSAVKYYWNEYEMHWIVLWNSKSLQIILFVWVYLCVFVCVCVCA